MNTFLSGPMRKIAKMGRMGDTELAHVTPEEKRLLKAMGGSGTINPRTGMPEYYTPPSKKPPGGWSGGYFVNNRTSEKKPSAPVKKPPPGWIENQDPSEEIIITGEEGADLITDSPDVSSEDFKSFLFSLAPEAFFNKGFIPYDSTQRFAGFDPMQLKAFGAINQFVDKDGNVITPSQFTDAANAAGAIAGTGGTTGFQSTYSPGTSTSGFTAQTSTSGYDPNAYRSAFTARDYTSGYNPNRYRSGFQAQTSTSGYNPNDYSVGFKTAGQDQEAFQRELDARMNPFTQGVINQLQKDISEQQQLALGRTGEQARAAGAFGGSRQGVAEALTSGRYGDAFARTAGQLRADQFNRAMSGADADRRAAEQFAQSGYGMSQQAQQAKERFRQGAFDQTAQDRARAEQFAQSGFGLDQQAQQARERFRQGAFGLSTQERSLAEQYRRAGYDSTQAAMKAKEQLRQSAFDQTAQDRARAEQFRQGAFGQTEQAKQFADTARQRAAETRLSAASDLRATGQAIDDATASRINALSAAGKQRQALDQALKDFEYQQFLEGRDFDKNQLLAAAGLLGSAPGDYYPPATPQYYGRSGGLLGDFFNALFGETQLMG